MPGYRFDAGCLAELVAARRFAVAFTNVDLIAGYDPATDRLIAEFVDTNRNGIPDAGDTVTTNAFPLDFTTTGPVALATVKTFTASSVQGFGFNDLGKINALVVFCETDWSLAFRWTTADHRFGESYREETWVASPHTSWSALEDSAAHNELRIRPDSPSAPNVAYEEDYSFEISDAWFDVRIDIGN